MCKLKTSPTLATTKMQRIIWQLFAPQHSETARSDLIERQSESCDQLCIQVRQLKLKFKYIKIWSKLSRQKATAH
jgi:hypothetical protein